MEKQMNKSQGITLIALVVTIVVLLILAAISIGMLTGDNGIITQAQKAREETIIADEKEILNISYVSCMQENMMETLVREDQLQRELDNNKRNTTVVAVGEDLEVEFNDTNHKYVIYQDGTIEQIENLSPEEANKIVDVVAYCESGIYVLTAEGKVKKANVIEGNIFDILEVEENAETITRNGVKDKGNHHFIDNKGKLYIWGSNNYGQLGDGTTTYRSEPICISDIPGNALNGKKITKVYAESAVMAIDSQGKVYTWGYNYYGQLGDGTKTNRSEPLCISDILGSALKGKNIIEICTGSVVRAIDSEGKVYTWGTNDGLFGDGGTEDSGVPICISDIPGNALNGKKITVLSSGGTACVVDSEGKVYTWGSNGSGDLGNGASFTTNSSVPICISDILGNVLYGKHITEISRGGAVYAIDTQGKIYTWGRNNYGQLGNGTTTDSSEPVCISDILGNALNGKNIKEIYPNYQGLVRAIDTQGKVYTWGYNRYGKLGDGSTTNSSVPICISDIPGNALNGKSVIAISGTVETSIAMDDQGKIYTWGRNNFGQLGNGTTTDSSEPICISDVQGSELNGEVIRRFGVMNVVNDEMFYYVAQSGGVYIYLLENPI